MLALEVKGRVFIEKVNSRCFCCFPAATLLDSFCPPILLLHTKLYKGSWNVSANNSETVGHKDLRFGQIVYILVFYSFSWLLLMGGFQLIFFVPCLLRDSENEELHFWQNVITFRTLRQLGTFITFRPSTTDNVTCRPKLWRRSNTVR